MNIKPCMGHISGTWECEYWRKSIIIGEKNTDLKRLTGQLKLRFLTEIGHFHWNQGEEVAHFAWFVGRFDMYVNPWELVFLIIFNADYSASAINVFQIQVENYSETCINRRISLDRYHCTFVKYSIENRIIGLDCELHSSIKYIVFLPCRPCLEYDILVWLMKKF